MSELTYNYSDTRWEHQRPESNLLPGLALLAMIASVINCALPEIEMLLTGGNVPIPQGIIKIGCFGFIVFLMVLYGKLDLYLFPRAIWLMMVLYLAAVFPFLWFAQSKEPSEIFLAYNAYYCPLIFAPAVTAIRGKLSERAAMRIFLSIFAVCALLGWVQFIVQDPIVKLASNDGNFRIFASQWMQGGDRSVRAMSFFAFAQEYGSFLVLVAATGIGMCMKRGGWKIGIPIFLIATASCYTTMTRATFIQLFIATVAALTFTFGRKPTRMRWQPLIALGFGIYIAFSGVSSVLSEKKSLADDSSLQQRLMQWGMWVSDLQHSSASQQLFGLGFCSADRPAMIPRKEGWALDQALVDNLYLGITLHIGLIGAVLVLALLWGMWRFVRIEAISRPTPLMIGIASFWSTFLFVGMFNIQAANYGFWFLTAVIIARRSSDIDHAALRDSPMEGELNPGMA